MFITPCQAVTQKGIGPEAFHENPLQPLHAMSERHGSKEHVIKAHPLPSSRAPIQKPNPQGTTKRCTEKLSDNSCSAEYAMHFFGKAQSQNMFFPQFQVIFAIGILCKAFFFFRSFASGEAPQTFRHPPTACSVQLRHLGQGGAGWQGWRGGAGSSIFCETQTHKLTSTN